MRASGKPTRYTVRQAASRSVERPACPRSDMDQPLLPLPVRGTAFRRALGLGLLSQLHLVVLLKPSRGCSNDVHLHIAASRPDDRTGLLAEAHESVLDPSRPCLKNPCSQCR